MYLSIHIMNKYQCSLVYFMEQFQDRYVNLIAIIIPNDLTPYEINHCKTIMESLIKYSNISKDFPDSC